MAIDTHLDWKIVVDRELLMHLNTCAACGRKFNLGEPVVLAEGSWEGPPQWVHEDEADFDRETGRYVESKPAEDDL